MTGVRPFAARVVRPAYARRTVTAMTDSQDDSGVDLYAVAIDPDAYADAPPALYVYRQSHGDVVHTGLVCEVAVQAIADGLVREHEAVHQMRVDALVWHHSRTHSPPALVKLLHRAGPAFTDAVSEAQRAEPILDFDGPKGLRQALWRLGGEAAAAVSAELSARPLYIADGHHRTAAALEEWRTGAIGPDAGLLCVVYPLDGLSLSAFHRRVSGPIEAGSLLPLLDGVFDVTKAEERPTPAIGRMGLYVEGQWHEVRLAGPRPAGTIGLDVSLLHTHVLDRLPPAPPGRVRTVDTHPEVTPLDELVARCDVDRGALFTLAPPTSEDVVAVADAGEVMPPKATYFEPKPAAGIFLPR